jgi:hypothetical protein
MGIHAWWKYDEVFAKELSALGDFYVNVIVVLNQKKYLCVI